MLFNSYEFIFGFLPAVLCAFWLIGRFANHFAQILVLIAASFLFYAWWDVRFLPLLLISIAVNYWFGRAIALFAENHWGRTANILLALGITLNLCAIGVFKYADFVLSNLNFAGGLARAPSGIILPLGISFFTFEQIGFLVDVRRRQSAPSDIARYAFFVSFFPRLVAGPILRYHEIVPQLTTLKEDKALSENVMVGLTIFSIGLVKKVIFADNIAGYVGPIFGAAAAGYSMDFFAAWGGALAYTCQLYFDFSGYSDMAIGVARCFGIRFPMNFFSPYKAASIIDFWRRWHITLSRFLRDYLYFSLGGNRRGPLRRYANLMATMLLGGLWHGANWTFVFWGGLHGAYLIINHAWINLSNRSELLMGFRRSTSGYYFGRVLTFLAVVVAWVFFRSSTFDAALALLSGMAGLNGAILPVGFEFALTPIQKVLTALGVTFGDVSGMRFLQMYLWIVSLLAIAFLAPNTQQFMARYSPVVEMSDGEISELAEEQKGPAFNIMWKPSVVWAVATGILAFASMTSLTRVSEFLYWQF